MLVELRDDQDEYLRERLCKIPLAPLTLVIIEEKESPMDSGAPAPKKGQTVPDVEGFAPLVLALPIIVESSLGFIQKGTLAVPAIRGFDPLVLPKPIQGIFGAPSLTALEATLPSLVIIGPKMFSLVPNLQTQEGVVICMPKPFPYKDSHRVPWKYDVTLISTRAGKEEVCSNISSGLSGLTRSGRCYTSEELEERRKEIGKGTGTNQEQGHH